MTELLFSGSYFCIALTLGAYLLAAAIQRRWKLALLNPIVLAALMIMGVLRLCGVSNETYQAGCKLLTLLTTPATICLTISFYEQVQKLKKHLWAILLGVTGGSIACLGTIALLCRLFSLDRVLTMTLLPKSITSAIGAPLSQELGGIAALTTAIIILAGVLGNMTGPAMCRALRITHPVAQGVAFGTSSHVVGTARANQLSPLIGAVSSLSLTIAGLLTVAILSFLAQYL